VIGCADGTQGDPSRCLFKKAIVARLYRRKSYLEAYAAHTDMRVRENPYTAVGKDWDVFGPLQYNYLVKYGLEPTYAMLNIDCGTLRGGRHFIRYLDPERYTGMDISVEAIAFGNWLVEKEGLIDKRPTLLVNQNRDLRFGEFAGRQFDYLLAQSVFTHLPAENIEECFAHVGGVMRASTAFFFTLREGREARRTGKKGFVYPFDFFEKLTTRHGFAVELMTDYDHPS
jgi:hypothetical protein